MYILFPIGTMYYFGTNLDSRFAVPNFWPKDGETHTIPFEKDEISEELQRLKNRRLAARARRLELVDRGESVEVTTHQDEVKAHGPTEILQQVKTVEPEKSSFAREAESGNGKGGLMSWFR